MSINNVSSSSSGYGNVNTLNNLPNNTPIKDSNITPTTTGNIFEGNENVKGSSSNVKIETKNEIREKQQDNNNDIAHDAIKTTPQEQALNKIIQNHSSDVI